MCGVCLKYWLKYNKIICQKSCVKKFVTKLCTPYITAKIRLVDCDCNKRILNLSLYAYVVRIREICVC